MRRKNIPYFDYCKKGIFIHDLSSFWVRFDSFDVNDSWHVILALYLLR